MTDKAIRKIVYSYAAETCPAVDGHFDDLVDSLCAKLGSTSRADQIITELVDEIREKVKADGTILLRDAMFSMAADYEVRINGV